MLPLPPTSPLFPYTTLFRSTNSKGEYDRIGFNAGNYDVTITDKDKKPLMNMKNVVVSLDRKSTRLNSSHVSISYAVFCLKKKRGLPMPCPSLRDLQLAFWRS